MMGVILGRVRRVLLTAVAILVFLVLAGATYQGAATALERRQFPHPGRLVDVGGHQLHIYCAGEGVPTVVLEAPATGMSAAWGWVQPEIARITRVCSYDRAGLGWSEAGDRPYEPSAVPGQLHTLLQGAKEPGPYVVACHGLGAAFATSYAAEFGAEVAGLVLVDMPALHPEPGSHPRTRLVNASPWLARTGVLRATRMMSGNAAGLPGLSAGALGAFLNRPDHLTRAATELSRWDEAVGLAADAASGLNMVVMRVEAAGSGHAALLTDAGQAAKASAVVTSMVGRVRAGL
jgi:pimeloyl-ACP methyl ester carboxylesterase